MSDRTLALAVSLTGLTLALCAGWLLWGAPGTMLVAGLSTTIQGAMIGIRDDIKAALNQEKRS